MLPRRALLRNWRTRQPTMNPVIITTTREATLVNMSPFVRPISAADQFIGSVRKRSNQGAHHNVGNPCVFSQVARDGDPTVREKPPKRWAVWSRWRAGFFLLSLVSGINIPASHTAAISAGASHTLVIGTPASEFQEHVVKAGSAHAGIVDINIGFCRCAQDHLECCGRIPPHNPVAAR